MRLVVLRLCAAAMLVAAGLPRACADDAAYLTGRVVRGTDGAPIAGATVAVYDARNRVIDYARTDSSGSYILTGTRSLLNLARSESRGLLYQVVEGVGRVAGGVGRLAVAPVDAGLRAVSSAAPGDPLLKIGSLAAGGVATMADSLAGGDRKGLASTRSAPGAVVVKVCAPAMQDAFSVATVYWAQEEVYRVGGKQKRSLAAWIDPAALQPVGSGAPSGIGSDYMRFTEARLEPSIIERGERCTLTVRLVSPPEPAVPIVVVACNAATGVLVGLESVGDGVYRAEITADRKLPRDDQSITVLAYAAQPGAPGRSRSAESEIRSQGLWDPKKTFVYNPLVLASRSRAEVVLTVVERAKR